MKLYLSLSWAGKERNWECEVASIQEETGESNIASPNKNIGREI